MVLDDCSERHPDGKAQDKPEQDRRLAQREDHWGVRSLPVAQPADQDAVRPFRLEVSNNDRESLAHDPAAVDSKPMLGPQRQSGMFEVDKLLR